MLEKISAFLDKLSSLPYWQIALLALLVAGGVVGGYFILRSPPRPESNFHPAGETIQEEPRELTVHVAGAVNLPGVYRLHEGDRVVDALEKAGGPLAEADLESLNLAQQVQDGQKIVVPVEGEEKDETGHDTRGGGNDKVNLNYADRKELEELPGIGPTLAGRIMAYREEKGSFRSVEELKQVAGIGEKKFAELHDLVEI